MPPSSPLHAAVTTAVSTSRVGAIAHPLRRRTPIVLLVPIDPDESVMLDTPHPAAPWSRLQVDDHALGRGTDVEVGTLVGALDLVDLVIGARWIVVEEEQRPRA